MVNVTAVSGKPTEDVQCGMERTVTGMAEYIDKEAFIGRYRELHCKDCDHRKGMKNGKIRFVYGIGEAPCRACWIEDMIDCVDDWPAADVRENVKARWIDMGDHLLCSACGATHYEPDKNFCPNCGAKMGGAEDGT